MSDLHKLSDLFYGCKKFKIHNYLQVQQSTTLSPDNIKQIFTPYTTKLESIDSSDNQITLFDLFTQFMQTNALRFMNWPFEKLSCWLEIAAHVFQHSFQKHLNKKESFQYFTQVVVRHSLFRPPHCVDLFTYDDAKELKDFWMDCFVRFYDQYWECFQASLNEILTAVAPSSPPQEDMMTTKKEISREDFKTKFGEIIPVNEDNRKKA